MFHVGQMVVCIDDGPLLPNKVHPPNFPQRGRIYTVRGFAPHDPSAESVWLEELINPPFNCIEGFVEPAFWTRRFRAVKTTSIEIFRQLVANPKDTVRA